MTRKGSAVWKGGLKDGQGVVSTETGAVSEQQYHFKSRFEENSVTNPEELIAAAHASCFSMKLSGTLGEVGMTPEEIRTTASVTIEGGVITKSHLDTTVRIPGADEGAFQKAAENAKQNCPVSKALNLEITMTARLEG